MAFGTLSGAMAAELRLESALGEPFRASVDLSAETTNRAGAAAPAPELAGPDEYEARGLEYLDVHDTLTVEVVRTRGRSTIELRSLGAVNEPAFHILLTTGLLTTGSGGDDIVEFGVLMDQLGLTNVAAAPPAVPSRLERAGGPQRGGAIAANVIPVDPATVSSADTQASSGALASVSTLVPTPTLGTSEYGPVRRGETLWAIARDHTRINGGRLNAVMGAIAAANSQAFIGGNINRLKVGAVLQMPGGAASIAANPAPVSPRESSLRAAPTTASASAPQGSAGVATAPVPPAIAAQTPVASASPATVNPQVARIESGITQIGSVGGQLAKTQSEIGVRLGAVDAKLRAIRARMAAQTERVRDLITRAERLGELALEAESSVARAATQAMANARPPASVLASATSVAAVVAATEPAAIEPAVIQAAPAPPAPTAQPISAQENFFETIEVYDMPILIGIGALILVGLAAWLIRVAPERRQTSVGRSARDKALHERVRQKTGQASLDVDDLNYDDSDAPTMDIDMAALDQQSVAETLPPGISDVLKEVDVYVAYGQTGTAREKLIAGLEEFPGDPDLMARLAAFGNASAQPPVAPRSPARAGSAGADWRDAGEVEPSNVIAFTPRGSAPGSLYELGISIDTGDEEASTGNRNL